MLVSVTLVLLMMTMFASIFQMATASISKQRAISNNDQRVRALSTIIRSDFAHRTFRFPQPFYPGENSASVTPFGDRAGYIYISTNDPYSSIDDLIQFTVSSDIVVEDPDSTPYSGKASLLVDRVNGTPSVLAINTNQPESDDGALTINSTGGSSAAEICYFVRNGNLYRKVLLLREPLPVAGKDLDEQPTTVRGANFFNNVDGNFHVVNVGVVNDFWKHFDYSAISAYSSIPTTPPSWIQRAAFVGASSLSNEQGASRGPNVSLGNPTNRFGFNPPSVLDSSNNIVSTSGLSREHTSAATPYFIGRMTHSETSATNFNWPQQSSVDFVSGTVLWSGNPVPGNPFDLRNSVNLNTTTGVLDEFSQGVRGGDRRMEDLLLSNVHEFKIEIWDERLQKYTTPGHQEAANYTFLDPNSGTPISVAIVGDYHAARMMSAVSPATVAPPSPFYENCEDYGPLGDLPPAVRPTCAVFDTWHPNVNRNKNARPDAPPWCAYRYLPPAFPEGPSSNVAVINDVDRVTKRADNRAYWRRATTAGDYQLGDVAFAPWDDSVPAGGNGDGVFQYSEMPEPKFNIAYRVVGLQGDGRTDNVPPTFPTSPGKRFRERNNEIEWESLDNRRPLTSIRLTIRFLDPGSETLRQLTQVIPLVDKK